MDYTSAVIAPTKAQQAKAIVFPGSRTVGAYDRQAIKYGYLPVKGEVSHQKHADVIKVADEMSTLV